MILSYNNIYTFQETLAILPYLSNKAMPIDSSEAEEDDDGQQESLRERELPEAYEALFLLAIKVVPHIWRAIGMFPSSADIPYANRMNVGINTDDQTLALTVHIGNREFRKKTIHGTECRYVREELDLNPSQIKRIFALFPLTQRLVILRHLEQEMRGVACDTHSAEEIAAIIQEVTTTFSHIMPIGYAHTLSDTDAGDSNGMADEQNRD